MDHGLLLIVIMGGATTAMALISYNEWKHERSAPKGQLRGVKEGERKDVAARGERVAA